MIFENNDFDLVVPIGCWCINSYNLRRLHLQNEAMPFDWVGRVSLNVALEYLSNNFKDYLVADKLELTDNPGNPNSFRMPSGIMFVHDFKSHDVLGEFQAINIKYQRRIKRLYDKAEKAKSILFVHCTVEGQKTEDPHAAYLKLTQIFPGKRIKLLYIYLGKDVEGGQFVYKSNTVDIAEINFLTYDGWNDKQEFFDMILPSYRLKNKISWLIGLKNFLVKKTMKFLVILCACCVPNKKMRHSLKDWYRHRYEFYNFE